MSEDDKTAIILMVVIVALVLGSIYAMQHPYAVIDMLREVWKAFSFK